MRRKARLSPDARAYLRRETTYLAARSPAAALRFIARIDRAREQLGVSSMSGPPSLIPGIRRLVSGDYILTYVVLARTVEIAAIRHGRQRDPNEASSPDENVGD